MNCLRRREFNVEVDWATLPEHRFDLEGVSDDVEVLRFLRVKNSHRGISRLKRLRTLVAFCVNQECLEEIAELPLLETLHLHELKAADLQCLGKCRRLKHLIIIGGTKIPSLSWVPALPPLDSLLLENLKLVTDISPVEALPSLKSFGIEGGMHTVQRVNSFQPISDLTRLEALFLLSCRPLTDGLKPLFRLNGLRYLEIAGRYPDAEFIALREAVPRLNCGWFYAIDEFGSIKTYIKEQVSRLSKT